MFHCLRSSSAGGAAAAIERRFCPDSYANIPTLKHTHSDPTIDVATNARCAKSIALRSITSPLDGVALIAFKCHKTSP